MHVSKAKVAIAVLTLLLLVTNGMWFYTVLDDGVTRTHRADQVAHERDSARLLADIVLASGLPLDRPHLERATAALPEGGELIVEQEGPTLYIDELGFVLEGDRVTRIHFRWEP